MYKDKYTHIIHHLDTVFCADMALDKEDAINLYKKVAHKASIEEEIKLALSDKDISWKEILEKHEVFDAEDEEKARNYLKEILWDPLFD